MIQAISQSHASEGSSFGSYIAELLGVQSITPKKSSNRLSVDFILDTYQATLEKKIQSSYKWAKFADYLFVDLEGNNRVVVVVDAPEDVKEQINFLEFGTPGAAPDPLIRVSEAEFNDDFQSKRMFLL